MGRPSGLLLPRFAKLRYVYSGTISSVLGGIGTQYFRANSIYDPDYTGLGGQPMGHDTYEALYDKYIVVGSKLSVDWSNTQANDGKYNMVVGNFLTDTPTYPYTTYTGAIEAKKGNYRNIIFQRNSVRTKSYFSTKKYFNIKDVKDNVGVYGALFGANPQEPAYFLLWAQSKDGSTSNSVQITAIIDYIILLQEPKTLSQS